MLMNEDQWMYDGIMSEEVDMNDENEDEVGVNKEEYVDCSKAFNTSQWAQSVAYEIRFVAVIMRSSINNGMRERTSFVLIGCEMTSQYRSKKKDFVRRDTDSGKCECPFKFRGKPMVGGQGWMVKLMCGSHNHELVKSLVGHPYVSRLTKDEKTIIVDMIRSMVKPRNILLTLKEHNVNSCTTIKQIYNARSVYHSSIRGSHTEMQHLMKLLKRDHTYKTNRYKLPLLDFVGETPTGMTFSAGFVYLEGERVNNMVWALEQFRGLFLRCDALPRVIMTDRDLTLMNAVKTVFPEAECTNLLCKFHIDKNVKAKCKFLIDKKNAWEYVMDVWGSLVDCRFEHQFDDCLKKFEIACSPWSMFVDYVNETWIIPTRKNLLKPGRIRIEYAHWALKRLLQNSLGDLYSVWDAMNNMMTLQHTEIKASFETITHVVGHVFKVTLYKRLLGIISRYALNQIASEYECVHYIDKNPSRCGCVMKTTYALPCACELSKYVLGTIPLDSIHIVNSEKLRTLIKTLCPTPKKVNNKGAKKKLMTKHQRLTKRDPSYWEYVDTLHSVKNSNFSVKRSALSSDQAIPRRTMLMLDQFHLFIHNFIKNIVDVKADGNRGYHVIAMLLGMGEDSWSLVCNHLLKELAKWFDEYVNLFGGIGRFEELKRSLLVDGLSMVTMDKWMDITDMGYVIASQYNVILVSLSLQQSMTFSPLRSQPPIDSSVHRIICIGHVFGNHFVQRLFKRPELVTASSFVMV
ncbi:Protein FAR1-RELATED SEQUENCE 5 [Glycine soja]